MKSRHKDRKFYKLNEIACFFAHLLRCIKGLIHLEFIVALKQYSSRKNGHRIWIAIFYQTV